MAHAFLGRIAAKQGDFAAARAFHEESLREARAFAVHWVTAFGLEGLAETVVAQGAGAWAAHLLGAAEVVRERCGMPLPPVERGDHEAALVEVRRRLGAQAFASAWAAGREMTPAQALAAEPQVAEAAAPAIPPAGPEGLTAREGEVLRLVAQGLTNPQIAAQLTLSPLTVHAHLRSIYSKLGVTTRSAATRYALDHHLV